MKRFVSLSFCEEVAPRALPAGYPRSGSKATVAPLIAGKE